MVSSANGKKILILIGSPRKTGNSFTLAEQIIKGAEASGAECETVYLNDLNIRPCQACEQCQTGDVFSCSINDDMQALYPKIIEADGFVIATPVYWFNMSSQTKLFMDRFLMMINMDKFDGGSPGPFDGKKTVIALSYADEDPFTSGCINALRTFQDAFAYAGPVISDFVYGQADKPGEIKSNLTLMEKAVEAGKSLAV
ncbi:MAG: flavodoxin family protein [Desulfobacterales bacterium]|nr:flavodoxin family protein [Desulfobacterales bacterium]